MPFGSIISGGYSIGKGIVGVFGKHRKTGTLWSREAPVRVGETLTQGGDELDQAYVDKLNKTYEYDLSHGTMAAHIWTGYESVYQRLRAARRSTGAATTKLPVTGAAINQPTELAQPVLAGLAGEGFLGLPVWAVILLIIGGIWYTRRS